MNIADKIIERMKAGEIIVVYSGVGFQTKIGKDGELKTLRYDTYEKVCYKEPYRSMIEKRSDSKWNKTIYQIKSA